MMNANKVDVVVGKMVRAYSPCGERVEVLGVIEFKTAPGGSFTALHADGTVQTHHIDAAYEL